MRANMTAVCYALTWLLSMPGPAFALSIGPQPPPATPRPGDPHLSRVGDERLKELYQDTILQMRTLAAENGDRVDIARLIADFVNTPKDPYDADYILQAAARALKRTPPPDWPTFRTALWAAKAGMQADPRIVPIARVALTSPRGPKLSDSQGYAILDSLEALGNNNSSEAIDLLLQCVTQDFWGDDPIRSRVIRTDPNQALVMVRTRAIYAISKAKAGLSLPALEELSQQYPDRTPPLAASEEYTFDMGAGYTIAEMIWEVQKREQMETGPHPFEEYLGVSAEEYIQQQTGMSYEEFVERRD